MSDTAKTILVVEDDAIVRMLIVDVLENSSSRYWKPRTDRAP